MIVAVDGEKPGKSSIVGFLEVGLLPSPIGLNEPAIIRDDTLPTEVSDAAVTSADEILADVPDFPVSSDVLSNSPEMITASPSPLASETQTSTSTEADVTNNVAISSDSGEAVAVSEGQNPGNVLPVDPNVLVLAAAAIEAEQKRKNKREEVPYLGNVAVSQDCR